MNQAHIPQAFKISQIRIENSYTKTFVLNGSFTAKPGQFVMAWLPNFEDKPFSLANADPICLTVAAVGPFSQALHRLQVGERLWLRGPLGRGYRLLGNSKAHILLVGGGYGVAPLLFLAKRALASNHRVSVIVGARSGADLLLVEDFEALDVSLRLTTEDGSLGQQGLVTDAMAQVVANSATGPQMVYACGPPGMLQAVATQSEAAKLPIQLAWEAYMRCGIGLCGSCEVGQGWLTCLDGPVFPFNPVKNPPPELVATVRP